jgi:SET domain-containing protein
VRKVEVRVSPIEGLGLFAIVPIRAGELIFEDEAGGEAGSSVVMTDAEFAAYIKTVDRYSASAIGAGLHRVSVEMTDVDYGNHSCDPNTWLAGPDDPVLVARRVISPGDEITSDYVFWTDTRDWRMDCRCGAADCRSVLTGDDWRLPILHERYVGHWPGWLEERIRAQT